MRLAALLLGFVALGCYRPHTTSRAVSDLNSMSVRTRHRAAEHVLDMAQEHRIEPAVEPLVTEALLSRLESESDIDTRVHVIEALGEIGSPTVADALYAQLVVTEDPELRDALVAALAKTGDPRVKEILDVYLQTEDHEEQKDRAALYRSYMIKSRYAPDQEFPRDWPYGTRGFPEPVNSGTVWIEGAVPPPKFMVKAEAGVTMRVIFDIPVVALDFDTVLGARTRAGIWGARFGMLQGATTSGLGIQQFHLGPSWEAPTELVRPSLQLRFSYLNLRRNTSYGDRMDDIGFGARFALTFDLWRHVHDHAVYLSAAGVADGLPDDYLLAGGTLALGGRY